MAWKLNRKGTAYHVKDKNRYKGRKTKTFSSWANYQRYKRKKRR